jgi:filamentous hemagglutinin family protein
MRPLSLARSLALALLTTTALTPLLGVSKAVAQNLPTGTSVASGSVGVQRSQTTLTLNQSSQNAIVNYSAFSIGQGYTVTINQPTSTSVILNRVTGDTPSTIAGQLNANGQVYLINPNGIAITKTGVVKIGGGFVASTLAMTDDEFKHGRKHFIGNGSSAGVSNAGIVTIGRGGYAALIGGEVTNSGLIAVPMGKVGLGSGEAATLDVSGDGFLQVAVPTLSGGKSALIQQSGTISADGGMVVLTAATARAAARDAINIPGTIDARSIGGQSGAILIGGGEGGGVEISGDLDASSPKGGGGAVTVTGESIALKGASIDASGATGGGAVKIGGDVHGAGALQQADQVTIDANSKITADATEIGDGGAVAVWSTGATTVAGAISARGGQQGGDGGMIETSGANLNVTGAGITAAAPKGASGAWLLDPTDLIIDQALATSVDNTLNGGTSVTLATSASGAPTGAALTAGETNASGNGDIIVNAPLAWSSAAGLTLNAYNNITVNAPITFGGAGSGLTLNAGAALNIAAPIKVNGAGTVSLAYNTAAPTNLSFGLTTAGAFAGGVTYNAANGSAATSAVSGQSLSVNGAAYTLVYNMTDIANINTALGGNYALATNIDASTAGTYTGAVVGGFSGTFEGLGDTISNLTINAPVTSNVGATDVGLFRANSGTLRDFALAGGSVIAAAGGNFTINQDNLDDFAIAGGAQYASQTTRTGSVVGNNSGTIFGVATSAAVSGVIAVGGLAGANTGTILNSMASGAVTGVGDSGYGFSFSAYETGGLVGLNYMGTVSGSWATGAVSGYTMVGGLIGAHDDATTTGSYATGAVTGYMNVGGLIGNLEGGALQSSYATGAVTGLGYQYGFLSGGIYFQTIASTNVGGLIGEVYDQYYARMAYINTEQYTTISSSYATGAVTAANGYYVGGLIGYSNSYGYATSPTTITGVYATGAVSGSQNVGGLAGRLGFATLNDANATGAVSGNQAVGGLIGQLASVMLHNASASGAVTGVGSGVVGVGGLIGVYSSLYPSYSEAANISASGAVTAPDGANYVGGLIGVIANDLTYQASPLLISNASATGTVTVGANASNVGGLVGADGFPGYTYIGGAFLGYDPTVAPGAGSIAIDSSFASGAVTAGDYATAVGGLIGNANDSQSGLGIANSYATSSVTVGKNATNIGGLVGDDEIQGAAYNSQLAIQNDFATGSVTAGAAATNVGGLFGTMNSIEIDGVYATGAVTVGPNSSAIGGFAGAIGSSSPSIPSAVGAFEYIDLYGFSTGRVSAGPGSTSVDASIGANGQTVQPYDYIVYNSDTAGVGSTVGIAETTADFTQNGSVASALNSNLSWAGTSYTGGTNGLYPYAGFAYPGGVQAITGYAYTANGAVAQSAGVALAGLGPLGQTTTGANGAYYIALPAGTLGTTTLTTAASLNAATLTTVAATGVQSGVNLYGNTLSTLTSATLLSAAPSQAQTRTQALTAAGTDAAALSALAGATGYGLVATGSSFTIDQGVSASGPFVAATATAGAPLTVAAPVSATGSVLLQTSGALTIAPGGSVSGASPVLATTGAFINQAGGAAVTATSGAWQIFSAAPTGDTFGGLNSGDMAIWNTSLGTVATASGDRYVFAYAPVLTVATVNDAKTYGVDATSAVAADYVITGLQAGVAGAYLGDTAATAYSGAPSVTSPGAGAGAVVGGYADQLGLGTLTPSAGYSFNLQNTAAFTVNPALLTITANNASKTYGQVATLGATAFTETGLVTANGDTVGGVTLASTGAGATATVAGGPSYAITASNATGTGLGNYTISYVAGALTVNPAALTITANAASSTYGSTPSGLTGAVTGLVNGETLQSATTGALSFATTATATSNVGSYAITGSGLTAISGNYTLVQAPANTTALTINPATLTYTATAASSTYGSTPSGLTGAVTGLVNGQTLQAATTGALSFATTATATSNVGSYAINGAGLTANNGDYIFAQAAANSSALTVNPAALTITASNQSKTYGQTASLGATAFTQTGLVNSDTISAVTLASTGGAATANVAASPYAITASNAVGSGLGNYTISYGTGLLTVNPAALTYTANAASSTYGSTPSGLTGAVTGLVNGETLQSATTGTLSFATTASATSNVGNYAITGSGLTAANANYTFVQAVGNGSALTVSPATLTYTANATSSIYGSAPAGLAGTVAGLVNGQSLQSATTGMLGFTTTATATSNVGSYAITGSGLTANNGDYTFAQAAGNGSALTVNPRAIILSGAQTYNGATTAAAANLTISNLVAGDTVGLSGAGVLASKNAGAEALASANGALSGLSVSNANYTVVGGSGVVAVNPLAVTLAGTQVYNGTAAVAGSALSVTNLVGGDSVTVAGGGAMAGKDVGSQALASLTGLTLSNANYTVLGGSGSVTVTPASLTYTANAASRTYGATNPMLSGTVTGFVGGDTQASATSGTLGFASTATSASNVGSYAVTGSGLTANNGDYTLAQAAANSSAFTVNPATLTITANNTSKTYGQTASLGAMAFTQTGLVTANGDAISGVTLGSIGAAATATVAGGPYTIMVSNAQGAGLGNYTINYLNGALTVNPAALTITANNASKIYGQTVSLGATAFSETGLVNSDTVSSVTLASVGATAGASVNGGTPYAITASNATGSGLSNYTISYGNGALTVNPATLAITASNQSKTYGQTASLGTTAFNESGLVNGDTIAGVVLASTGAAATATVAGPYAITASNATGSGLGNYAINYGTGALTVNPATLTITADNASKIYGQTASLGATAFVETGLVNSDTVSGVSLTSTGAAPTATVSGGPYVITASNAIGTGLGNYAISYANGALAVSPATLTITANNTSKTYGQTASLGATAFTETGLVAANGDTISGVALASTGAAAGASVNSGTPYAISAYNATGSGLSNYTIGYVAGGLTVSPLAVTLAGAQVYSGTTAVAGSALSVTNLVGGDSVTVAGGGALAGKDVGAQALASLTGLTLNNANYTLLGGAGSVTVTPANLTYTANAATRTYGASDPTLSGTVTGFVGGDTQASATSGTLNFASSATTASNVGSYAITGSGLTANNGDYALGQAPANSSALAITPATLTYAANAASSTYGSTPSGLTGAVTGLVNGQTLQAATTGALSFTTAATATSNVGPYAITGSGLTANNGDYTFAQAAGNASALSVNPAALAITADNASKTYGQTANLGTTAFTEAGLVNGDTVSAVTLASTGAAATATVAGGPYAITASNASGSGLSNYTISYGEGALTVNAATLAPSTAPAFGLAATGLGSTIESAALKAFGNPGGSPPLITSTLWSLPSSENDLLAAQIVGELSNPLFDKIVVCFKGVCTLAPAPAPPRKPQTTSQIPGWDHSFSLDAKSPLEQLSARFGPGT